MGLRQRRRRAHWQGEVAGPDRLRFLGMLSRYAALLGRVIGIDEDEPEAQAGKSAFWLSLQRSSG